MSLDPNAPSVTSLNNNDLLEVYHEKNLYKIKGSDLLNSLDISRQYLVATDYANIKDAFDDAILQKKNLFVPKGTHTTTETINLPVGLNMDIVGLGGAFNTIIECTSGDLFSGPTSASGITFRNILLRAKSGSNGTIFSGNADKFLFNNVVFQQQNANQAIIYHDSSTSGLFIGNTFDHCSFYADPNTTVSAIQLTGKDTISNNIFNDCWCYYSSTFFFDLHDIHATAYSANNRFSNILFEITNGGNIRIRGLSNTLIQNCATYDTFLAGDITGQLYYISAGTGGLNCINTTLISIYRDKSATSDVLPDIYNDGINTTIIGSSQPVDFSIENTTNARASVVLLNNDNTGLSLVSPDGTVYSFSVDNNGTLSIS